MLLTSRSEFDEENGKKMKKRRRGKLGKKTDGKGRESTCVCVFLFFYLLPIRKRKAASRKGKRGKNGNG